MHLIEFRYESAKGIDKEIGSGQARIVERSIVHEVILPDN